MSQVERAVLGGSSLQFVTPYNQCRAGPDTEAIGGSPLRNIAVGSGESAKPVCNNACNQETIISTASDRHCSICNKSKYCIIVMKCRTNIRLLV
jgi:hypothetical protein